MKWTAPLISSSLTLDILVNLSAAALPPLRLPSFMRIDEKYECYSVDITMVTGLCTEHDSLLEYETESCPPSESPSYAPVPQRLALAELRLGHPMPSSSRGASFKCYGLGCASCCGNWGDEAEGGGKVRANTLRL